MFSSTFFTYSHVLLRLVCRLGLSNDVFSNSSLSPSRIAPFRLQYQNNAPRRLVKDKRWDTVPISNEVFQSSLIRQSESDVTANTALYKLKKARPVAFSTSSVSSEEREKTTCLLSTANNFDAMTLFCNEILACNSSSSKWYSNDHLMLSCNCASFGILGLYLSFSSI
ncbi:hypothetical protein CEXT_451211 [Caerostris extrusa]|uniref:Uncharacterized protein n=1 Tax=Caerostris extrusa TaxID=172846 RepID=A0AAV4QJR4_CAEEX|nr:hypothetical protein CEXT_451211 [Caerostris extrusa]